VAAHTETRVTKVSRKGNTLRVEDGFRPTPIQSEFFQACDDPDVEEILFDGSIRGGKTQAACKKLLAWAWTHGGRYLIARKTYRELRDSTQAVFLRGEGDLPPTCPPELVKMYRASDETIYLRNGAEILFRSLENRDDAKAKLRNLSLNAAFIDQVEELDEEADAQLYEELLGRLSDPRGPGKMLLAANPGPEDHWVHRRFVNEETKKPWCRRISVTLWDNQKNLDPKYFSSRIRTEKSNPDYYKRFILGQWGAFGGKRFKAFDQDIHVTEPFPIPSWWEIMEGIDYGYQNPFCCLWIAIGPEGHWFVVAEHYESEHGVGWHSRKIKEIRELHNLAPSVSWLDPSCWAHHGTYESVAMELSDRGIFCAKAQNERLGGWARLDDMLITMIDGKPQLRIFNTCRNLIRELPSAKLKDDTDDIIKRNDHALDALRYAVMSRPPTPHEPEDPGPDDLREVYAERLIERARGRAAQALYMGG